MKKKMTMTRTWNKMRSLRKIRLCDTLPIAPLYIFRYPKRIAIEIALFNIIVHSDVNCRVGVKSMAWLPKYLW